MAEEWFSLPRLGTDVFMKLVREAGLKYEKGRGFKATVDTDLVLATSVLEAALGEPVEVEVRCFLCGEAAGCHTCTFKTLCDRRKISPHCICERCKTASEAYATYTMRFAELMEQ